VSKKHGETLLILLEPEVEDLTFTVEELALAKRMLAMDEGAKDFWVYCKLKDPLFYRDDRPHLRILCETLQAFFERRLIRSDGWIYTKLMINMPPRHGKTRTLTNFCQWVFGRDKKQRVIAASYNDGTAGDFSKWTRDGITEVRHTKAGYVFSDFFPNVRLRQGSGGYAKWALEGEHFNYLGAGLSGELTSKGASILIADDLIKGITDALNENECERVWRDYTQTFLSRGESETGQTPLEVMCMTPWIYTDPCGRIVSSDDAINWYRLCMPAYDELTGKMLCESILSYERYKDLEHRAAVKEVFYANYQMEFIDIKGALYPNLKTYDKLPVDDSGRSVVEGVKNRTDTADEGDDFLCSVNYAVYKGDAYVLDVLYTKDGMEVTEPQTAKFLFDGKVNVANIESNNGGRGFARNVERILREKFNSNKTVVRWFHQSLNKRSRIMTNAAWVQEHIYFPLNWKDRWPEFHKAMTRYLKEAKNKHDDAPDCITGIAEDVGGVGGGFYDMRKRII
jgi:predicted phage terminase large subunit-like protein